VTLGAIALDAAIKLHDCRPLLDRVALRLGD